MRHFKGNTDVGPGAPGRMRRARRGLALGATVGAVALVAVACGSSSNTKSSSGTTPAKKGSSSTTSSGLYGSLPAVSSAASSEASDILTIGTTKGSTPLYAMPIVPSADNTVFGNYDFIYQYEQPMYQSPEGATEVVDNSLSFADLPTYSNDDKTVTIKIKPGWKWSNGDPVTAANVIEFIDISKAAVAESPDNFADYSPGLFPSNVATATAPSTDTLVLTLTTKYNPGYFTDDQLGELFAMPTQWMVDKAGGPTLSYANPADAKLIYNYLNKQASDLSTVGTNPLWKIDDGPTELNSFNATTGGYTLTPNPDFGGPQKMGYKELDVEVYTSNQAEFNELEAGNLDISSSIDNSNYPELPALKSKGYSYFGLPDFGFQAAFLNFKNKTGDWDNIIGQQYVREALQELQNEPGDIKGIFKGAAEPDYTTVVAVPKSPYAPADASTAPYPYSPSAAAKLLASHGWKKVGGVLSCESPGTAAADCGSGIPKGTPLKVTWQYASVPTATGLVAVSFASEAKSIGIGVTLEEKTFNDLVTDDNNPSSPSTEQDWEISDFGGFTSDLYPTTITILNSGGDENLGSYSSTEANTLINNSVYGGSKAALSAEASYMGTNLPVLFQSDPDYIYAVKDSVGGTNNSFLGLTQFFWAPEYWYPTGKS